jgi:CheY-like chemotaxis protein
MKAGCADAFERTATKAVEKESQLLRCLEGTINIETSVGKGTTSVLSLPATTESRPTTQPESKSAVMGRLRVLIADDEDIVRHVLREYLAADGHVVVACAQGRDVIEKFQRASFDVIIVDLVMPGMNGDEVAVAVKQLSPQMPIILFTGFGSMIQASGEAPLGVDLVLSKPVTIAGLRAALAKVLAPR